MNRQEGVRKIDVKDVKEKIAKKEERRRRRKKNTKEDCNNTHVTFPKHKQANFNHIILCRMLCHKMLAQ
jgi:hypothetical protein